MPTLNEQRQLSERVKNKLEQLLKVDISSLIREVELGNHLNFKQGEEIFQEVFSLFSKVNSEYFMKVSYSALASIEGNLDSVLSIFEQIRNFNPNSRNPVNVRDNLLNQLEQQLDGYNSTVLPILTAELIFSNRLSVETSKLNSIAERFSSELESAKNEAKRTNFEIQNVLEKARQAAAEVGVSRHNMIFKEESEYHEGVSKKWLNRLVLILFGIIVFGFVIHIIPLPDKSNIDLIHFSVTKIVIFAVLFYALNLCSKNYRVHRHNFILNKHRQNALNTFETFTKAAGNDFQTKNAVLLEATRTIFSNQQTGYLKNEADNESPNKIIEILKSSSDKGS